MPESQFPEREPVPTETEENRANPTPEEILDALIEAERLRRLGYGWQ